MELSLILRGSRFKTPRVTQHPKEGLGSGLRVEVLLPSSFLCALLSHAKYVLSGGLEETLGGLLPSLEGPLLWSLARSETSGKKSVTWESALPVLKKVAFSSKESLGRAVLNCR